MVVVVGHTARYALVTVRQDGRVAVFAHAVEHHCRNIVEVEATAVVEVGLHLEGVVGNIVEIRLGDVVGSDVTALKVEHGVLPVVVVNGGCGHICIRRDRTGIIFLSPALEVHPALEFEALGDEVEGLVDLHDGVDRVLVALIERGGHLSPGVIEIYTAGKLVCTVENVVIAVACGIGHGEEGRVVLKHIVEQIGRADIRTGVLADLCVHVH